MRNKKSFTALTAAAMAMVLLASCGKSGGDGADPGDNGTPAVDITSQPAEVVFYSNNGDPVESFDYRFGNAIRKKFPNWTIQYIQRTGTGTQLQDLIANGTKFDIFFQSIGNFEANAFPAGIEYDMTELIKNHKVDLNRLDPTVVDAVKQASGGKFYGLPVFTTNLVLYYNKTLFDKFGVPYPKDGITWSEMVDLSKRLTRTEGDTQYFGFTHSPVHTLRMNPLSIPNTDIPSDTPTINKDDRWKTYFQTYYLDPMRVPGYLDGMKKINKIPDINMFVKDQSVGMFGYLSSLIYVWEQELKALNWDIVSFPTVDKGIGSQSYPSYFGITNMARNKAAAMEVLKFMISDEFQSEMARKGIMPVLQNDAIKKELGKESPYKDRNWNALFYNKFAPIPAKAAYDADMVTQYISYGNQVALDKMDLNTALRKAEEDSLKKIQEYKSKTTK
ncbi:MAG: extracellular solute-binding protein family 1 [Paenibacillus sp.]|jgi:multiple sugar transport system substrate-binding protein|uniref:extracellular solute-binding protein n=1 Tax=Paenibacillus sp. GCM10012303 TaxID=3317340 RepID=UPI0029F0655C|nr:extracellular solute-binding protein family 1 [Paenibacillus sp.]